MDRQCFLTRTVNSQPVAAIREYLATKFCNGCFREPLLSAYFLHKFDGDLVEELQSRLSRSLAVSFDSDLHWTDWSNAPLTRLCGTLIIVLALKFLNEGTVQQDICRSRQCQ